MERIRERNAACVDQSGGACCNRAVLRFGALPAKGSSLDDANRIVSARSSFRGLKPPVAPATATRCKRDLCPIHWAEVSHVDRQDTTLFPARNTGAAARVRS